MPQYIACPNAAICSRTGFVPSTVKRLQECNFCGRTVRSTLKLDGFLPYGWTTHEMAENVCYRESKMQAAVKVEHELARYKAQNSSMSNGQAKKFIREYTIKYEAEIFIELKAKYKL
jgi:hypothetical protein